MLAACGLPVGDAAFPYNIRGLVFTREARGMARVSAVVAWLLLSIAALLRLTSVDLVSITGDEGIHGMFAMNIAIFRDFPLVGLPSVGIRNSAFFVYMLAPAYLVSRHPLSGVVLVILLNLAALYLLYRMARSRWGTPAALIAVTLATFSPWAVMYARNMWPPSCVPILALSLMAVGFHWLDTGKPKSLFWAILLTMLLPQMHFSGFCGVVWTAGLLWSGRRWLGAKSTPAALSAAAIGFVTLIPWFYYQHALNNWSDISQALAATKGKHGLLETLTDVAVYFDALMGAGRFEYWFATTPSQWPEYFPGWLPPATRGIQAVLLALFFASAVWGMIQSRADVRLLVLWSVLPLPMLLLIRPDVHPHYVGVAFPIPFLLIAIFLQACLQRLPSPAKLVGAGVVSLALVATTVCHTAFLHGWYQFVRDGRPDGRGHFQLSYRQRTAAADSILRDCPDKLVMVAGAFSGLTPAYHFPYSYEQMRRGVAQYPADEKLRYWVDEGQTEPTDYGWVTEREWRVGPTRILKQRLDPAAYLKQQSLPPQP